MLPIAAVAVGFVILVWGADRFVTGAAASARNLGVDPLIIGLTIVGFGTSAPEMLVSGVAAYSGSPSMGIGNALGSNITNVTLVLGSAALVRPLRVSSSVVIRELPVLLIVMIVAWLLLVDGELSRADGIGLLVGMCLMVGWVVRQGMRGRTTQTDSLAENLDSELPARMSTMVAVAWIFLGLVLLLAGSRILVWGAVEIARVLQVSELVIGLSLVALGTSLPELAASIIAAKRGEHDIAVGNVVGSNMFNLLGVLALPGVIAPGAINRDILSRDYPIMFGVTALLLILAWAAQKTSANHIGRRRGAVLILIFVTYIVMLFMSSPPPM